MNRECDIVRDLLPLYVENIASTGSRELIQSHLENCQGCREVLAQISEEHPLHIETDPGELLRLKKRLRRRTVFAIALSVSLALTVFAGLLVCGMIPVWVPADEAIVSVEMMDNGQVRVETVDSVHGINSYNNTICFEKLRLEWFLSDTIRQMRDDKDRYFYFTLEDGDSLWYSGEQTGNEDVLLWGDGSKAVHESGRERTSKTLVYMFWISVLIGLLLLLIGVIFRRSLWGKLCLVTAIFALCCAASCLFVTDCHLITKVMRGNSLHFNRLPQQLIGIGSMTLCCFSVMLFSWLTIKEYKN